MTLLLINGWQGVGTALTVLLLLPGIFFSWVSWKSSKSGQTQQAHPGSPGVKEFKENTPFYKVNSFKYAVAFFAAYIIGMGILISDYSSKVSKRIPQQQTDTTRQAAEDMVKPVSFSTGKIYETIGWANHAPNSFYINPETMPSSEHYLPFQIMFSDGTECWYDLKTGKWKMVGDTRVILKTLSEMFDELMNKDTPRMSIPNSANYLE